MLLWEGLTFFAFLIAATWLLFWFYWRDIKRTRGLEAFFASVTHELRTPLTSIRLQAESIADSLSPSGSEQPLIQRLLEDSARLESQVERTLELARVEGGGPLFSQTLPMKPWISRLLSQTKESYAGKSIAIQANLGDDDLIEADEGAVQVIIKNLVENSLRHSQKDQIKIEVASRRSGDWTILSFKDNGPGTAEKAHQLGGLFQKGARSQGAGVGLYLVKVLMERMGGRAVFSSAEGFPVELWFQQGKSEGLSS
jgi:signal transduction histidine kinase